MSKFREIDLCRDQIALVDDFIMQIISQRQVVSKNLGAIKKKLQVDICDNKQEKKVKSYYVKLAKRYKLDTNLAKELANVLIK